MAWRLALGLACSLDQIPRTLHVARCGLRLTDTQAECKFSVQHSVSEIDIAGSIEPIEKANTVQTTFNSDSLSTKVLDESPSCPAERADPSPGIPWHIIQKMGAIPLCRMMG